MTAPIWRVEVRPGGTGEALVRLHVGAQSWSLVVCEADEAEWHARAAEHAMRAVEVAVLREAQVVSTDAYSDARRGGCDSNEAHEAAWAAIAHMIAARLPDCAGCTGPASEGTHAEGTRQHP